MITTSSPQLNAKVLLDTMDRKLEFTFRVLWFIWFNYLLVAHTNEAFSGSFNLSAVLSFMLMLGVYAWVMLEEFQMVAQNCTEIDEPEESEEAEVSNGVVTYRISSKPLVRKSPWLPEMSRSEFLRVFRSAPYTVPSDLWGKLMLFKNVVGLTCMLRFIPMILSTFVSGQIFAGVIVTICVVFVIPKCWAGLRTQQVVVTENGKVQSHNRAEMSVLLSLFGLHDPSRTISVKS